MSIIWKHKNILGLTVEKETEFPHPSVEGLRLRAYPNGRKSFVWQRQLDGKRRKKTLGRFPALKLAVAESMCSELNDAIDTGDLPQVFEPKSEPTIKRTTVTAAWALYIADMERRGCRTVELTEQRGIKDILPVIGAKFVNDVTPDDIREIVQRPIERNKGKPNSRARTGGGSLSNMMVTQCRMFFRFCLENGYDNLLRNPALAVKKMRHLTGRRKRRVMTMREMALAILAAREFDREKGGETCWADIITLICMNGNRKTEVKEAAACEWDRKERVWRISPERYKTDVEAVLPVGPTSAAIFEKHCRRNGFLIPYQTGVRTGQDTHVRNRLWALMEEISGEKIEEWWFHSLRYGFRANIRKAKIADSELAERIIHPCRSDEMSSHYDPEWQDEMREALAAWDAHLNAEIKTVLAERLALAA